MINPLKMDFNGLKRISYTLLSVLGLIGCVAGGWVLIQIIRHITG